MATEHTVSQIIDFLINGVVQKHTAKIQQRGNDRTSTSYSTDEVKCIAQEKCHEGDTQYGKVEVLKFRNSLFELVEELRLRRIVDQENEEKILQLVKEKHSAENKFEEKSRGIQKQEEHYNDTISSLKKKHRDTLNDHIEEKTKFECTKEIQNKEIRGLKDEIRVLQLRKYNLEKKTKEQEKKIQFYSGNQDIGLSQIGQLEESCGKFTERLKQLTENHTRLEMNVKEATILNKSLTSTNKHQQCIINKYRSEIEILKQQLQETRVTLDEKPWESQQKYTQLQHQNQLLTDEIEGLQGTVDLLKQDLQHREDEVKQLKSSLEKADNLLERHIQQSNKYSSDIVTKNTYIENLTDKYEILEKLHKEETENWEEEKRKKCKEISALNEQVDTFTRRLKSLQGDFEDVVSKNASLDDKCTKLAKDLERNKDYSEKLLAELNKPKSDAMIQTSPTTTETDTQTYVAVAHVQIQVYRTCCDRGVQSEGQSVQNIQCQTDEKIVSSRHVQTDLPDLVIPDTPTRPELPLETHSEPIPENTVPCSPPLFSSQPTHVLDQGGSGDNSQNLSPFSRFSASLKKLKPNRDTAYTDDSKSPEPETKKPKYDTSKTQTKSPDTRHPLNPIQAKSPDSRSSPKRTSSFLSASITSNNNDKTDGYTKSGSSGLLPKASAKGTQVKSLESRSLPKRASSFLTSPITSNNNKPADRGDSGSLAKTGDLNRKDDQPSRYNFQFLNITSKSAAVENNDDNSRTGILAESGKKNNKNLRVTFSEHVEMEQYYMFSQSQNTQTQELSQEYNEQMDKPYESPRTDQEIVSAYVSKLQLQKNKKH